MPQFVRAAAIAAVVALAPAVAAAATVTLNSTLDITQQTYGDQTFRAYFDGPAWSAIPTINVAEGDTFEWTIDFLDEQSFTVSGLEVISQNMHIPKPGGTFVPTTMTGGFDFLGAAGEVLYSTADFTLDTFYDSVGQVFQTPQLGALPSNFTFYGVRYSGVLENYGKPGYVTRAYDNPEFQIGAASVKVNAGVPEPGAWALMILGFASVGATLRSRRRGAALSR